MSFVDKVSCGTALMLIQEYMPEDFTHCDDQCANYFRHILVCGCGGAAVLGLLVTALLARTDIGNR